MIKSNSKFLARCAAHGLPLARVVHTVNYEPSTGEVVETDNLVYLTAPSDKRVPSKNYSLKVQIASGEPLKKVNTIMFQPSQEDVLALAVKLNSRIALKKEEYENENKD